MDPTRSPARGAGQVAPVAAPAAPWFGRPWEHRHAAAALAGSLAACSAYWAVTRVVAPDVTPGWVEFSGTATSLWSVWITQRRNVLAMPVGIVSVVLMGAFFAQIGLLGQAWLHWGYYVVVQVWGWHRWTRGGQQGGELRVTRLSGRQRVVVVALLGAGTAVGRWLLTSGFEQAAIHATWDASIVAASVIAMVLLSAKKVESWWLWILPVNVSAIGLYLVTGATMFAALYMVFLVMAVVGLVRWHRAAAMHAP